VTVVHTKKIRYAEWIRLDDSEILHVDVRLEDCAALLPFLRASGLKFDSAQTESRGEEVTFHPGTTVSQVHAALAWFDELNRKPT
jgi:hypothetical protein